MHFFYKHLWVAFFLYIHFYLAFFFLPSLMSYRQSYKKKKTPENNTIPRLFWAKDPKNAPKVKKNSKKHCLQFHLHFTIDFQLMSGSSIFFKKNHNFYFIFKNTMWQFFSLLFAQNIQNWHKMAKTLNVNIFWISVYDYRIHLQNPKGRRLLVTNKITCGIMCRNIEGWRQEKATWSG